MKRILSYLTILCVSLALSTACVTEDTFDNSPEGNFEALWRIIDHQYCFLEYKYQEYGLDWDQVYSQYKQRISPQMNDEQLF